MKYSKSASLGETVIFDMWGAMGGIHIAETCFPASIFISNPNAAHVEKIMPVSIERVMDEFGIPCRALPVANRSDDMLRVFIMMPR